METTKNELPKEVSKFFKHLSDFLDTKLYYYGSVQRTDYLPGKSDIDVDIFTENEFSTMSKLEHFLNIKKSQFQKVVWLIKNKVVYGYKLKFKDKSLNLAAEFSIYNEKFKKSVLDEHLLKFELPFHISILLNILKTLFYNFNMISPSNYASIKRMLLSNGLGLPEDQFLVLNN